MRGGIRWRAAFPTSNRITLRASASHTTSPGSAPSIAIIGASCGTSKRFSPEFTRIFGKSPRNGPEDPYRLAEQADPAALPALRLDCGADDPFLDQNRAFHQHLESLEIAHEYQEYPGTHSWHCWDLHVREALDFHRRNLNIPDDLEHALLR